MNDLISRESAIDSIYKNHMNGKEGVKQDVENLHGSAACFSETLQDAVESIEELPAVPAIPISVIEGIKAEIDKALSEETISDNRQQISDVGVGLELALNVIDRHIKEYTDG